MLTLTGFEQRYPVLNAILGTVGDRIRDRAVARDRVAQLKALAGRQDLARAARDLGLSRPELDLAMALSPGFVALLSRRLALPLARRMAALGIDRQALRIRNPRLAEHMAVRCADCALHARCDADLDRDPDGRAWQRYCGNAGTLARLQAA